MRVVQLHGRDYDPAGNAAGLVEHDRKIRRNGGNERQPALVGQQRTKTLFHGAAARHIQQGQHHFLLLFRGEDGIAESLGQPGGLFHCLAQSTQRRSIAFQFRHARLFPKGKERRGIAPGHDIADHCSTTLVNDLSISF